LKTIHWLSWTRLRARKWVSVSSRLAGTSVVEIAAGTELLWFGTWRALAVPMGAE